MVSAALRTKKLDLSFPALPGPLLGDAPPCAEIAGFLAQTEAWLAAARAWLTAGAVEAPISDDMRRILRAAVRDPDVPAGVLAAAHTYRVEPVPAPVRPAAAARAAGDCASERRHLLAVLVWRARLVDFLADVWDVVGPAPLGMEECEWVIRELLSPASTTRLCLDCLQPMPSPDFEQRHLDRCIVRIARGDPEPG